MTKLSGAEEMHHIVVLNAKGGCGKTTVATTLACYFSNQGYQTALMDFDPQHSSTYWLRMREENANLASIKSIDACRPRAGMTRTWQLHSGAGTDIVVVDTPAGVAGGSLLDHIRRADTLLIPVMSSVIDLHAVEGFLVDLARHLRNGGAGKKVGIVANRVRLESRAFEKLKQLAESLDIPIVATLRDSHNYSIAMESGKAICELSRSLTEQDQRQWQELINWVSPQLPEPIPQPASTSAGGGGSQREVAAPVIPHLVAS